MDQQTNQTERGLRFNDILISFKKNWILILVVVILFSALGVVYGKFQKPVYTARHQAFYSTRNIVIDDINAAEHINAARAFMDTVADFADEEYVVKRADYLYGQYLKEKQTNPSLTAKTFLSEYDARVYKKHAFNSLPELVQSTIDVFFLREVEEKKQLIDRTFVVRGTLVSVKDNMLSVMTQEGTQVDIDRDSFLYAIKTESYMSEYAFYDLPLLSNGDAIKVYTTTDASIGIPTEISGKFVSCTESDLTIDVNGVEVRINKENYKRATRILPSYFYADNIGVDYTNGTNDTDESFVFTFKYTDVTPELAIEKVQFVIKAMDIESKIYFFNPHGAVLAKFVLFKNVEVSIAGAAGYLYYTSSVSKIKTFILFFAIGVVAGCLISYVKELLDKTVKRKEDLENLTDTKVLTVIPLEGDK